MEWGILENARDLIKFKLRLSFIPYAMWCLIFVVWYEINALFLVVCSRIECLIHVVSSWVEWLILVWDALCLLCDLTLEDALCVVGLMEFVKYVELLCITATWQNSVVNTWAEKIVQDVIKHAEQFCEMIMIIGEMRTLWYELWWMILNGKFYIWFMKIINDLR